MGKELLDENTVVAYLTNRGIISGPAEVEELTGGVSNVVLAVKSESKDLVLKQALPQLKVAAVWKADQRRAIVEANGMKLYNEIIMLEMIGRKALTANRNFITRKNPKIHQNILVFWGMQHWRFVCQLDELQRRGTRSCCCRSLLLLLPPPPPLAAAAAACVQQLMLPIPILERMRCTSFIFIFCLF